MRRILARERFAAEERLSWSENASTDLGHARSRRLWRLERRADGDRGGPAFIRADQGRQLHLYVSNQSFDRAKVDIVVVIDGRLAVEDEFAVGNQHNWVEFRFDLEDGEHVLRAESVSGDAVLESRFGVNGSRWAVVDYWCCYDRSEPKLTFHVSAQPLAFA
jgi:hypothetical protein